MRPLFVCPPISTLMFIVERQETYPRLTKFEIVNMMKEQKFMNHFFTRERIEELAAKKKKKNPSFWHEKINILITR